jgi:tRNA(Arg) A34 adenosine deaminase TadA
MGIFEKPLKRAYFFGVCLLLASLPFSFYMTSISIFILLTIWLLALFSFPVVRRLKQNTEVFIFVLIVIIHFIWLFNTENFDYAFDDIQKKLALLSLPIIFASMPAFGLWRRNFLLNLFVLTIFASGVSVLMASFGLLETRTPDPRDYSVFISHIRLSLMMVLSIFISAYFVFKTHLQDQYKILHVISILFNLVILVILQAFTGLVVLAISLLIVLPIFSNSVKSLQIRQIIYSVLILFSLIFMTTIGYQIFRFYHSKNPYPENKHLTTSQGNQYQYFEQNLSLENGNRVGDFIHFGEMENAWNNQSSIHFDSLDANGFYVKYTLIRYLTSKGEFKDGESVEQLGHDEITAIENGIWNYRFIKNPSGFNAGIYELIWQLHDYSHGGNPSGQSLSQRLEFIKTGWHIFLENPIFGIGTGDVEDAFKHQYRLDNSRLLPEFRHRTHNQYLTFLIAFGVIGFVLFLIAWIFPVIKKNAFQNYFFMVFFIIASLSMISEDSFETLTGSAFIATFYSLFLWGINHKIMYQEKFMRQAIELAKKNITTGNGPFGAVIVKDGEIIAQASNSVTKTNDPTAHAEINAIRLACEKLNTFDLSGCEIYSSCEPCPMCLGAIYWAQLNKLYFASSRKEAAAAGFNDEFIYEELGKTIRERKIPTKQVLKNEAEIIFKTWNEFEDKIKY